MPKISGQFSELCQHHTIFLNNPLHVFWQPAQALCEKHLDRFSSWILGEFLEQVDVLNTELRIEPIRTDAVTFLQVQGRIFHLVLNQAGLSAPTAFANAGLAQIEMLSLSQLEALGDILLEYTELAEL